MRKQHRVPPRRWARWIFRVLVTLVAALGLFQAALAGEFLSGHFKALDAHAHNAVAIAVGAGLLTLAAIVMWRPGYGPGWPALLCILLNVAVVTQINLGYQRVLAVHVPLGVAIIASLAVMLVWAWRRLPGDPPATADTPVRPESTEPELTS